jgi:transposase InsO family protein
VSRSGYYAREAVLYRYEPRPTPVLKPMILKAHKEGRSTYGSTRIQQELAEQEVYVGRDHIHRLRKELGLRCIQNRKFKATTNSDHDLPVAPNLLDQNFTIDGPGKVYGTDITYIPTGEGWLYLAGVKDFGSMEIVGYAMGPRMTKELVHVALDKALRYRRPEPDVFIIPTVGASNVPIATRIWSGSLECALRCLARVIAMIMLRQKASGEH